MPLVRIAVRAGTSRDIKRGISDAVHRALTDVFNVPADDRFQLISEYRAEDLVCPPAYLDIQHTDNVALIQITCNEGRGTGMKQALYRRLAELIMQCSGIRSEDVIVNLVEVKKENWSFGNGIAQYAI